MRSLLLASIIVLALAGCVENAPSTDGGGSNNTTGDMDMEMPAEDVQVAVGEGGVGVPPSVYTMTPKKLELKVGQAYNVTLKNNGRAAHDFQIPDLEVVIPSTQPGATSEGVLFTPMEAGTFPMYCTIGGNGPTGHRAQGMSGEVVVS